MENNVKKVNIGWVFLSQYSINKISNFEKLSFFKLILSDHRQMSVPLNYLQFNLIFFKTYFNKLFRNVYHCINCTKQARYISDIYLA